MRTLHYTDPRNCGEELHRAPPCPLPLLLQHLCTIVKDSLDVSKAPSRDLSRGPWVVPFISSTVVSRWINSSRASSKQFNLHKLTATCLSASVADREIPAARNVPDASEALVSRSSRSYTLLNEISVCPSQVNMDREIGLRKGNNRTDKTTRRGKGAGKRCRNST